MLFPRANEYREVMDLSGFWDFRPDPRDEGLASGWSAGFPAGVPIAVPASWNDQLTDLRDYLGPAWYSVSFRPPASWKGGRLLLRLDSVNYIADVWLNGRHLGSHEGGHLPFGFDATAAAVPGRNTLVVRVDGNLAPDRVPPGNVPPDPMYVLAGSAQYPDAAFDFFPFCGIHRPVRLCRVPEGGVEDIVVDTERNGTAATVRVRLAAGAADGTTVRLTLSGHGAPLSVEVPLASGAAKAEIRVPAPALWSPGAPNLYELTAELRCGGRTFDSYALSVGIRTVAVEGDRLLLNGEPVLLKGFGRHEDFPVTGRGLVPAVIVRDFELMRWTGANSFRTTHYPYSEEMMDLADRLGFLVIDETPAVGLFFRKEGLDRRLDVCRRYVGELIGRDRNRPSVIAWSLANEPNSRNADAGPFFRVLYDLAKELDPGRPVTVVSHVGVDEEAFSFCDLVCLNRYYGWYTEPGRIGEGCERLSRELDDLHARFGKPVLLTEFGTDAIAGCHADPPEMFSEEYQARFLEAYIAVADSKPYVAGQHVWNLCDFKTGQAVRRVGGMNLKGVFTRDRRPKMAAHLLRRLWGGAPRGPSA